MNARGLAEIAISPVTPGFDPTWYHLHIKTESFFNYPALPKLRIY
jgi:hypothetical protein